jgi:hypothetical protein
MTEDTLSPERAPGGGLGSPPIHVGVEGLFHYHLGGMGLLKPLLLAG